MKYMVLASGSGGNCTYIEIEEKRFIIDCGISLRQIQSRLSMRNLFLERLDGIFITHEHADHVGGLIPILNKYKCKVYMTEGTYQGLHYKVKDNISQPLLQFVLFEDAIINNGVLVKAIMSYHDALEPCGYRFTHQGKSLVYLTDSGYYPKSKYESIANADHYIIESNHDPELLLESNRTWLLKRRILDDQGHLSNEDSAFLMANVLGEKTKMITLAHLSEECNTESHALQAFKDVFSNQGLIYDDFKIVCAKQNEPLELEEL
jgi:phosphoribosyl 1,2-cyclic phosphodiesterase